MNKVKSGRDCLCMARDILRDGGVIVYPTDTLYGIGASISHPEALERVFRMKEMQQAPVSIILSDRSRIKEYAEISKVTRDFLEVYPAGPFTLLLKVKEHVRKQFPDSIIKNGMIGVRIPLEDFPRKLVEMVGPITSTSANIHGKKAPVRFEDVSITGADLYVDGGTCLYGKPSTILQEEGNKLSIVREGAIDRCLIEHYLG